MRSSWTLVQRTDPPGTTAPLPRFTEGQGTVDGGRYFIWGTWRNGDDPVAFLTRVVEAWVTWRFGRALSAAARENIVQSITGLQFSVLTQDPQPGQQYYTVIDRVVLDQLTGAARRDPTARSTQVREEAAGLPPAPPLAEVRAGTRPPEQASAATELTPEPTAGFHGGSRTADAPAMPATITGPAIQPTRAIGAYTMSLDYSIAGADQLSQVVEAMNSVHYHWEMFRITALVQGGMSEQMERHRQRAAVPTDRVGRFAATGRRTGQAVETIVDETAASVDELANPVEAARGGSAVDVMTRAYANYSSLTLLPATAIVSAGGQALGALADVFGNQRNEQEIPWPDVPGFYLIRCIAQPAAQNAQHRAASAAVKLVQVQPVATLAAAAVELPHAEIAEKELALEIARRQGASEERLAILEQEIAALRARTSGAAVDVIQTRLGELEREFASASTWQRRGLQRQIDLLREQLAHANARAGGMQGRIWRPEAAIVSRLDGQTYPLLLQLGQVRGSSMGPAPDSREVQEWRIADVSNPDGRQWVGRGATTTEAVRNAVLLMSHGNDYGPGSLAVRFPTGGPFEAIEMVEDNVNTGTAQARRRLADLATVLAVLGMLVPGVGQVAAVVGAAVAADRLLDRWFNGSLRMDAAAVSDLIGVFGAAAQAVSAVGGMRMLRLGDRFALVTSTADEAAIVASLRSTRSVTELAAHAGELANWGGFAFGALQTIDELMAVNRAELEGISHAEARRRRAQILMGAIRDTTLQFTPPPRARPAAGGATRAAPRPGGEPGPVRPAGAPADAPHAAVGSATDVRPVESGRLATLEPELGDLAGSLELVENPALGDSVLARYVDGRVQLEVGPTAGRQQVRAHVGTARLLRRFEGPIGAIRRLVDRIGTLLRLSPGYGTQGFESRLEVRKLTEIRAGLQRMLTEADVRAARMSGDEASARAEAESLQRELSAVEAQLAQHQALVDSYQPGRGFVAALDAATAARFGAQVVAHIQVIDAAFTAAGRPELIPTLAEVARIEASGGNIRGFADWVAETINRVRGVNTDENMRQAVDKGVELSEMLRLSQESSDDPNLIVRFNPGNRRTTFDIRVEAVRPTPGQSPIRREVEVAEHTGIPVRAGTLHAGIIHAASKIPERRGPQTGRQREAAVSVEWFPDAFRDVPGNNGLRRIHSDGRYEALAGDPPTPSGAHGSIPDDLLRNLRGGQAGRASGVDGLNAVNIVTQDGRLLWRFVNRGTAAAPNWERVQ